MEIRGGGRYDLHMRIVTIGARAAVVTAAVAGGALVALASLASTL